MLVRPPTHRHLHMCPRRCCVTEPYTTPARHSRAGTPQPDANPALLPILIAHETVRNRLWGVGGGAGGQPVACHLSAPRAISPRIFLQLPSIQEARGDSRLLPDTDENILGGCMFPVFGSPVPRGPSHITLHQPAAFLPGTLGFAKIPSPQYLTKKGRAD